jgi:CheY-like chemotaxis protein
MTTILLVDNDPLQASVCKSILERRFRDVLRVSDAAEAFCLVEEPQFAGHLALVISNWNMPGIGSPAFVAELNVRLPKVPILVLGSGDAESSGSSGARVRFLARPFASEQILAAAGELLSQSIWQTA